MAKIKIDHELTGDDFIADYVIERGANSNGSWEKWHGGKLIQKIETTLSLNTIAFQSISTPIPFVNRSYSGTFTPDVGTQTVWWDNMSNVVLYKRNESQCALLYRGALVNVSGGVVIELVGRWK